MKKVQLALVLLLLTAMTAVAQTTCAPHPSDPGATLIGSFTVTIEIAQSSSIGGKSGKKGTKCTSENLICVWRTSTGGTDLIGDPSTVKFSGSCQTEISPADLFAMFGQAAVMKAVGLGYVDCSPVCDSKMAARFLTATCVSRSGSGSSTRFGPCTVTQCVRAYTVCCPNGPGSPVINRAPADNAGCGNTPDGCQSACDQDCPPIDGLN